MQERSEVERRAIWPCLNVATWRKERSDRAIQQTLTSLNNKNNWLQSVKVFSSTVPGKLKNLTELAHQGGHFEIFNPFCRKSSKKWRGPLVKNNWKNGLAMPKKLEGDPLGFSTSILSENCKKIGENFCFDPLAKIFVSKKSLIDEKNWKGDPLVSPGIVCYAEREENPFCFSSLGQMIQFGTIKFRITLKNYFGQFVWIEKKSH